MLFKGLMTSASGSAGGITASHNRGGMYFRGRAIPTNPNSNLQQEVRSAMATASQAWRGLTQAIRDAWTTYGNNTPLLGPLGDPVPMSGINAFIRGNVPVLQAGGTLVTAAPTTPGLPTLSELGVITLGVAGGLSVAYSNGDSWANDDNGRLMIYQGRPQSAGRSYFSGPYRLATSVAGDGETPPTSPATVATASLPYAIAAGQACWIRVIALDGTGRVSAEQIRRVVIGA